MKRREFLRGFGKAAAGVTAIAAATTVPDGDDFQHGHWRVAWSGWKNPDNQAVRFGFWIAARPDRDERPYSTTFGVVSRSSFVTSALDTCHVDRSTPIDPLLDSPQKFEAAKVWAKQRLLEVLK